MKVRWECVAMRLEPAILRKLNERRVLNALRLGRAQSRTEIQKAVHLTLPTVSRIVDSLIAQGWVHEVGPADSALGRPPVLVDIDPSYAVAIGVDLGRKFARVVYTNPLAEILSTTSVPIDEVANPAKLASYLESSVRQHHAILRNLTGVGIATPAGNPIHHIRNPFHGIADDPALHWDSASLIEVVEGRLKLPTWVENDANAAALGEIWFGRGQSVSQIVFVLMDVGVGAGIGINGQVYEGARGRAGEFSDTIVDFRADPCECGCGKRGCVGIVANSAAIQSGVRKVRGDEANLSMSHIIQQAKAGVEPEASVVSRALDYLSLGVVNLIEIIDPNMVVLGGATLISDPFMIDEAIRKVRQFSGTDVPIQVTAFGAQAVAIGAATVVLQHVYDHTRLIENVT